MMHIMQQGNQPLLADIRKLWRGTLILNRPGRPREQIGADLASELAYGQMVLANPVFVARLKDTAPMNEATAGSGSVQ